MPFSYEPNNTKAGKAQRRILGLMAIAVIFALLGDEIEKVTNASQHPSTSPSILSSGAKIMLGGTFASVILMITAEVGDDAAQLSQGLAGVACVTSLLVKGKPVWDGIIALEGGKASTPSKPINAASTPSAPSAPSAPL